MTVPPGYAPLFDPNKPFVLRFDGTPPSFNTTRTAHWRKAQRVKLEWQGIFEVLLMEAKVPRLTGQQFATGEPRRFVVARAALWFPSKRRRDEGNYRTPIEKSLGDALVNMGVIHDDTPDYFEFGECKLHHDKKAREANHSRMNVELGVYEKAVDS